jgi:hypothetical protein
MTALEHQLDVELPTWRSITAEQNWARWLNACNPADGRLRSEQFVDAVRRADAGSVAAMMQRYLQEQREGWPIREAGRGPPRSPAPAFTREQIQWNYRQHQRGAWAGREAEWDRLERDMIRAAADGRVPGGVPTAKNFGDGR